MITNPKFFSLPRPDRARAVAAGLLDGQNGQDNEAVLLGLQTRRNVIAHELNLIDAEMAEVALRSICFNRDDTQDVETYDGSLGVTRAFVDANEKPVGLLHWVDDLPQRFTAPGDLPGVVNNLPWGTGALISNDLFLTAGHCFDPFAGPQFPSRNGTFIDAFEAARLMFVRFNFQKDGTSGEVRNGDEFPVVQLLEFETQPGVDYAIARLGANAAGKLPGQVHGTLSVAARDLTTRAAVLCIIQHNDGRPKRIGAGPMADNRGGKISYATIDTRGVSSGAPILSPAGKIVGVHTHSGCLPRSGANFGSAIGAIRSASRIL